MGVAALTRVLLSFVFVVALMLLLSWIAKRLRLPEKLTRSRSTKVGGMAVDDVLYIDARHRLVTIARGNMRHVLLISNASHASPVVVESYKAELNDNESIKDEVVQA